VHPATAIDLQTSTDAAHAEAPAGPSTAREQSVDDLVEDDCADGASEWADAAEFLQYDDELEPPGRLRALNMRKMHST